MGNYCRDMRVSAGTETVLQTEEDIVLKDLGSLGGKVRGVKVRLGG